MKKTKKHPGGRPTVITPEVLQKLEDDFAIGCDDELACHKAGISKSTLYNYCKAHPEFLERKEALKRNPEYKALKTVEAKLGLSYQNAMDYLKRKRKDEFSERSEQQTNLTGKLEIEIIKAKHE